MFISLNFCSYVLQIMYYVFQLSLTHASHIEPIPSIADIRKYNFIEITSMCYDDHTTPLDYEAIRHHLRFRYIVGSIKTGYYGERYGFSSYDVCNDKKKLKAVLTKIYLSKQYRILNGNCESKDPWNIIAILSFMPPDMTKLAAEVLASTRILYFASMHYGHLDTIPRIISNENIFTNDKVHYSDVNIILDIIKKYHIKHILLVYGDRDVQSIRSIHRVMIWMELLKIPDVCVDMVDLSISNNKNVSSLMIYIKNRKQIKLIITFPKISTSPDFVKQTNYIDDRIWIWYPDVFFYYGKNVKSGCHFEFFRHPFVQYYLSRKTFTSILNDSWIKRFNAEKGIDQSSKNIFNHFDVNKTRIGQLMEQLLKPLHGSSWILRYMGNINISVIRSRLRSYNGLLIYPLTHDNTCNATTITERKFVKIINYWGLVLHCKPVKCPPGKEPYKTLFTKPGFVKNFGWICKKCPSDKVKLNYSTDNCIPCPGVTIPDKDLINCFDPYTDEFLTFNDYKSIIVLSILIPLLTYNMGLIVVFGFNRTTPIIIASGSTSNLVQVAAHLLVSIEILVLFFGKLNNTKCTLQVVTTGTLFTLILSLLLTQTQKTLYVFKAKIQITRNDVIFTKVVQIFVSVTLMAIQILISVISYFQLTPTLKPTMDKENLKRKVTCNNELFFRVHYVYILILAILCSIQALRARNLPKYFTATAEIGYSMYITVVVIMVRFPILSSEKVDDKNFANALFIIVLNSIPMVIRYTKTLYIILFHPEKNTKEYVRNILLKNVRQKTEEKMDERNRRNKNETKLE